jgi:tetratricopeptide (TPR) repeat protein
MGRLARWAWLAAAIVLLGAVIYHPVGHFAFINLDDNKFIEGNPWLEMGLNWQSFSWAFNANLGWHSQNAEYWSPLTLLSRLIDVEFAGGRMDPGRFHFTSVVLHLLNALLLAVACWRLTGHWGRSAIVSLIFLVHPQNIEAVCWLSARKDLVSATFFFVTLIAYARYVQSQTRGRYALLIGAYLLAIMAKPMNVSLPLVLLALDFWPLNRWRFGPGTREENLRVVAEKIPLMIIATLAAGLAIVSQQDWKALESGSAFTAPQRIGNAVLAYFTYIRRIFWPNDLALFYPHPGSSLSWWAVAGAGVFMTGASIAIWLLRKRAPWWLAGWLWFGLVLGPVIGLLQIGGQAMADRYSYPATVGLFIALVWTCATWLRRPAGLALAALAVAAFTLVSIPQVRTWQDSIMVFQQAIRVTKENGLAHLNLGVAYIDTKEYPLAQAEFEEALKIRPQSALIWNNYARTKALQGDDQGAVNAYQEALRRDPEQDLTLLFLGRLLKQYHRWTEAQICFERLKGVHPDFPQPYLELGEVYAAQHRNAEARAAWEYYLKFRPADDEVRQKMEALPRE